jgi:biofilm PGA synthesis N-glycosyltransferase PgaC
MIPGDCILMFVLFIIFCFASLIQLFYWLWFYLAPDFYKPVPDNQLKEPVSVIICARNEAENLRKFLPSVLKQDYPSYEVIVVNDCSEDNSYEVLGQLLKQFPHLRISSISKDPKFAHNKKFAQFIGIKAASNELLIFTDADCEPVSDKWLLNMASNFDSNTDIVVGYGGYMKRPGLLNWYIRFDSMFIAMQYIGMALKGIPYMGVGRNLAYRRSLFFRNKGFGTHSHVISGDDDLFINSVASKINTKVELREESHTRSVPSSSFSEFVKQKQRHFTTAKFYKTGHKLLLFLEPFTRMLFYIMFAITISVLYLWQFSIAILGLRLIEQIVVLARVQKRFNEKRLIFFTLIFDILSPVINGILYIGSYRIRPEGNSWK